MSKKCLDPSRIPYRICINNSDSFINYNKNRDRTLTMKDRNNADTGVANSNSVRLAFRCDFSKPGPDPLQLHQHLVFKKSYCTQIINKCTVPATELRIRMT